LSVLDVHENMNTRQ